MTNETIPEPIQAKKHRLGFLKNKWFWIISTIILFGAWFAFGRGGNEGPFYETRKVEKGNVVQTVEVTGEIKPDARLNLAFSSTAPFESISKKVGSIVKRGDVIAELESRDLRFASERARASLAIAQANLSARLAGETKETIAIAQAQVDQAEASYDKAVVDLDITRQNVQDELRIAELAMEKAQSDFENSGATSDQSVSAAYANLRSALQGALGPMRSGLIDGDAEIGIDNTSANDLYEGVLGIYDRASLERAKQTYPVAKNAINAVDIAIRGLSSSTPNATVLQIGEQTQDALRKTQLYLDDVQKVLAGTITNANLSEASLASKRASIDGDRATVSSNLTSATNYIETARSSGITQNSSKAALQIAFDTAKVNYDIAKANLITKVKTAETNLAIQAASLASANATLAQRQAPPRSVDVAGLRAQVLDAQTAYQQARERLADVQIIAPVDGVVTDIIPSIGEQVGANVTAVKMVSTEGYSVEALVPEADIVKVSPDQSVEITLDAFGDDVKFAGKVISENPDQTKVSDAIYYKVYVSIDPAGRDIKPGMTANLTVKTGNRENVLVIPTRSIRERDGQRYVRVIQNGNVSDANIELGLRGDEGRAEVVSGLNENQIVVISEVSADEFGKLEEDSKVGN